jgi:hypothetical protein
MNKKFYFIGFFFIYLANCQAIIPVAKKLTTKKKTTVKREGPRVVSANIAIQTMGLINWNQYFANLPINSACQGSSIEDCNNIFNAFTMNFCQVLTYFKTPVCGGLSCYFDTNTGQCGGQCSNTVLEKCVSKVDNPSEDSHCACASSVAISNATSFDTETNTLTVAIPSCDASTCFVNSCSFRYISVNRQSDGVLYGYCNNDKYYNNYSY